MVENVIIAAAVAVFEQYLITLNIKLLIGRLNARVCPRTNINII